MVALVTTSSVPSAAGSALNEEKREAQQHCGAGRWLDSASSECVECPDAGWCPAEGFDEGSGCLEGRSGHACSGCDAGFFLAAGRCKECPAREEVALVWSTAGVGCVLLLAWIYRSADMWLEDLNGRRRPSAESSAPVAHSVPRPPCRPLAAYTLVMAHFQLCYSYFTYRFNYPDSVRAVAGVLGLSSGVGFVFDALQGWAAPACAGGDRDAPSASSYVWWWVLKMGTPVLFALPFAAVALRVDRVQRAEMREDAASGREAISVGEYDARRARQATKTTSVQTILVVVFSAIMHGVAGAVKVRLHIRKTTPRQGAKGFPLAPRALL